MLVNVISLLQRAGKNGVKVGVANGELQVSFSKGQTIDPDLLGQLKANKQNIINFLSNDQLKAHIVDNNILALVPANRSTIPFIPLSFSQERLLFIHQLQGSAHYHLNAVFKLKGKVDNQALQNAFRQVLQNHEVLRTCVGQYGNNYCQIIKDELEWNLGITDGRKWPEQEDQIVKKIAEMVGKPFDLFSDFMLRANLVTVNINEAILIVIVHHIAADGWSLPIIVQDLSSAYNRLLSGKQNMAEKELPLQFADYAIWQHEYLKDAVLEKKLNYWVHKLQNVEAIQLLTDKPRPAIQTNKGASKNFLISTAITRDLKAFSVKYNTTLFVTLLSAFKILLYRYTHQTDICVGTPIAGRQHDEVEGLVGFFANTLALRSSISPTYSFVDVVQQVSQTTMEAYEHQDMPFEKIVDKVAKDRDLSRSPIFQVMFGLLNLPTLPSEGLQGTTITRLVLPNETVTYELNVVASETVEGLQFAIGYFISLFEPKTIEKLGNHFIRLLEAAVAHPLVTINNLKLLSASDKSQLLIDFNSTETVLPAVQTITGLFEAQVLASPEAIACLFER
ncbi:condensation domain-containing protein, partial [Ferruginibacter sp.]|uniref:condensation domain-containing protein n=1 Tax=Ferruginibacter sp. TaxID=1940288 RepID=UPI0019A3C426